MLYIIIGTVTRRCIGKDIWDEVNECIREEINALMEEVWYFVF